MMARYWHLKCIARSLVPRKPNLPLQGSRSYAYSIDILDVSPFAHLYKSTSCEVEVAARQSEIDVISVAAGALLAATPVRNSVHDFPGSRGKQR